MGKEEFGKRKRETVLHVINPSLSWCGCPKLRSRQWKKCCTCPLSFAVFVVNLAMAPPFAKRKPIRLEGSGRSQWMLYCCCSTSRRCSSV